MKKTVFTLFVSAIMIVGMIVPVFAVTPTFKFENEIVDKTNLTNQEQASVAVGREITFTYKVSDFQNFANQTDGGKDGINVLRATLEYDDNVFYPIEINKNADGLFAGIKTLDKSGKPVIRSASSDWSGVTYNDATKRLVIDASKFINFESTVLEIVLKARPNATIGTTKVSLVLVEGSDEAKDVYPNGGTPETSGVTKEVEIIEGGSDPIVDPDDPNHRYIRHLPDTTVGDFKEEDKYKKLNLTGDFKSPVGTVLGDSDFIPTGAETTANGLRYTIISVGDLNSDGKLTATDLSQFKAYEADMFDKLNDDQKRACDIKWDAHMTTTDRSQLRMELVGMLDPKIYEWKGTGEERCVPVKYGE